jgi:peptide/nickel transport system permease protein
MKTDRVGMVSLYVTLLFIALVLLAQLGLLAKDWQKEVATPFAPPHFLGKITDGSQSAVVDSIAGPNVDISDVDPLAPRYEEWRERAAQFKTATIKKSDTLPFGGDQLGRDVLAKVMKGAQVSITVGLAAALFATLIGTLLGAIGGYFGGWVGSWSGSTTYSPPYPTFCWSLPWRLFSSQGHSLLPWAVVCGQW